MSNLELKTPIGAFAKVMNLYATKKTLNGELSLELLPLHGSTPQQVSFGAKDNLAGRPSNIAMFMGSEFNVNNPKVLQVLTKRIKQAGLADNPLDIPEVKIGHLYKTTFFAKAKTAQHGLDQLEPFANIIKRLGFTNLCAEFENNYPDYGIKITVNGHPHHNTLRGLGREFAKAGYSTEVLGCIEVPESLPVPKQGRVLRSATERFP